MTQPRHIIPGRVCFVTARAVRRMFLFLPKRDVVRLFQYLLAVAAREFGVHVHEVLCMSNHFHILLTDVHGQLPDFMHYFDSLLARSLNACRGSRGSVFEKEYGLVIETDEDKVIEHAVDTLANPCADHLVRRSRQWPGFSTLPLQYGKAVRIERPKVGLWKEDPVAKKRARPQRQSKPSRLPDVIEFELVRPPVCMELDDAQLREEIRRRLEERELALIEARRRAGKDVLGIRRVLAQRWDDSPREPETMFDTKPRVAGKGWIEELQRIREFVAAHARARARFLAGKRDVVWPLGTWQMRVRHGVPCETSPP
jgi:putative transposase